MRKRITLSGADLTKTSDITIFKARVAGAKPATVSLPTTSILSISAQDIEGFALLYLMHAIETNSDFVVDAPICDVFAKQLSGIILPALLRFLGVDYSGEVLLSGSKKPAKQSLKTLRGTGFSGGVDSIYTALSGQNDKTGFDFYTFLDAGQHGADNLDPVFEQRFEIARSLVPDSVTPLVPIRP